MDRHFIATFINVSENLRDEDSIKLELGFSVRYTELDNSRSILDLENAFKTAKNMLVQTVKKPKDWVLLRLLQNGGTDKD